MSEIAHRESRVEAGEVRARLPQRIRRVPIFTATLCHVRSGRKRIWLGERDMSAGAEQLILLPAGLELDIANLPGADGYLADMVSLPQALLDRFRQRHGPLLLRQRPGLELCPAMGARLAAAWRLLTDSLREQAPPEIREHHAEGALLALALDGAVGPLLRPAAPELAQRLRQLLALDPSAEWRVEAVARRLNLGASTLRRRLAAEGCGFQRVLEEVRMGHALQQVQAGLLPIARIAEASGYASASRFSARFRQRYGLTPSELRRTL
ncbi:AraC family transcriptional regulator [Chromobacterium phragmitis]|uniref:AraC family transcriptional regulator n=1 Tax=Chromobacterium phragmitis TaxID=2202141 RepID=A0A344UF47_9NEIS|nr:helix-turn-helix transcriptional regulator [Chromobacterium phragmitis]AXE28571.1 AraC family transcriptional regulator [Chromobacterium phragmitis]AXE33895.1 AraC family transcriptional regulator [Chromobacterium phragmitis]